MAVLLKVCPVCYYPSGHASWCVLRNRPLPVGEMGSPRGPRCMCDKKGPNGTCSKCGC